ncbi:MAG: ferrous iron transport protein A [Candidatus Acetothermia bacterium]
MSDLTRTKTKKLSELEYGQKGRIREIERGLKRRLVCRGVRVGKEIRMDTKQPINGPVVVTIGKSTTSLGLNLAKRITVEVNNDGPTDGASQRR